MSNADERSQGRGTQPGQEVDTEHLQVSMEWQARASRWGNRPGGQGSRPDPSSEWIELAWGRGGQGAGGAEAAA